MAIVKIQVETKVDKIKRLREAWIKATSDRMFELKMFDITSADERIDCLYVAESLYENGMNADGSTDYDPKDSADEELTYWGE